MARDQKGVGVRLPNDGGAAGQRKRQYISRKHVCEVPGQRKRPVFIGKGTRTRTAQAPGQILDHTLMGTGQRKRPPTRHPRPCPYTRVNWFSIVEER